MLKQILLTSVVALGLAVTGCAGKGNKNAATPLPANDSSGYSTAPVTDPNYGAGAGLDDVSGLPLEARTVYFAYDSSDIDPAGQAVVARFATYLASHPSARLRLEGHADERGTREYNVGLGERRGNTVLSALTAAGASPSQLSVVSYGEERPAVAGSDEAAYAKNRRVEIVVL